MIAGDKEQPMTESKNPRLSDEQVKAALVPDTVNALLEATPVPVEKCGEPTASFIPRWGMYFLCVLPKGHEGEHKRGGICFKHGEYVGEKCPQWPDCSTAVSTENSAPVSAPAEKKEWVTLEDVKAVSSDVFASNRISDTEGIFLSAQRDLNKVLAPRIEAHIAEKCEKLQIENAKLQIVLELAEVRAALKEAEWWDHLAAAIHQNDLLRETCLYCDRIAKLRAREAELLARGGAKP